MSYDLRTGPQKLTDRLRGIERQLTQLQLGTLGLALLLALLLLVSCQAPAVTPAASPLLAFDAPPEPPAQRYACDQTTTDTGGFNLACELPTATATATPEPTPTEKPSFFYLWCPAGDASCASGQFRVTWDRARLLLRCAVPTGDKVRIFATDVEDPDPSAVALAWVLTGGNAGNGTPCDGWVPAAWLRASN
jgi:hypothetical protein